MKQIKKQINRKLIYYLTGLVIFTSLSILGCVKETIPQKTDTYIYLVTRNNDTLIESISIENYNDGTGFMKTPEIIGNGYARTFNLTLDEINPNKWNFTAKSTDDWGTVAEGNGFFKRDSIYVEFKWETGGFKFIDIFSGSR